MRSRYHHVSLFVFSVFALALLRLITPTQAQNSPFTIITTRDLEKRAADFVATVGGAAATTGFHITCARELTDAIPVQVASSNPEFIVTPAFTTVFCGSINTPAVTFQPRHGGVVSTTITIDSNFGSTSLELIGNGVLQEAAMHYSIELGPNTRVFSQVYDDQRNRLYLSDFGNNQVIVFDPVARAVISRIAVGAGPRNLDIAPGNSLLYVANRDDFSISIIDLDTFSEIRRIELPSLYPNPNPALPDQFNVRPYEIAVLSDRLALLGGDPGAASGGPLFKLDLSTEQLTALDIPRPRSQAARPVMNKSRDGASVLINLEPGSSPTNIVRYNIAEDRFTSVAYGIERTIAVAPDSSSSVSTHFDCNNLISNYTIYDATPLPIRTIKSVGCQSTGPVFSPIDPAIVYGLDDRAVGVEVLDLTKLQQIQALTFPFSPQLPGYGTYFFGSSGRPAVISGDGRWLYIPLVQVNIEPPSRLLAVYIGPKQKVALPLVQR